MENNSAYINDMVDAYLEAAWWADSPENLAGTYRTPTKRTRAAALADCEQFCRVALQAGLNLTHVSKPNYISASEAGNNLWLTRQHHGAGFWDCNPKGEPSSDGAVYRQWDKATGDKLTKLAHAMGERHVWAVGQYFNID
jgi:hypothetical protein